MHRLISLFFVISFLGCSSMDSSMEADPKQVSSSDYYLRSNYPVISDNKQTRYLSNLSNKLGLKPLACVKSTLPVILDTDRKLALFTHSGQIYLSKGLIIALRSEAELAFILSHEFAHGSWCHPPMKDSYNRNSIQNELEADTFALEVLLTSGYSHNSAIAALTHTYNAEQDSGLSYSHPEVTARIQNICTLLNKKSLSRVQSSPTSNTKRLNSDFENFRNSLLANPRK